MGRIHPNFADMNIISLQFQERIVVSLHYLPSVSRENKLALVFKTLNPASKEEAVAADSTAEEENWAWQFLRHSKREYCKHKVTAETTSISLLPNYRGRKGSLTALFTVSRN